MAIITKIDGSVDERDIACVLINNYGFTAYEVEAYDGIYKYCFEIEAVNGTIVQWDTSKNG